ncbi:hypothetical protein WA158_000560 [Blastocystis sp. Blastoise]
MFSLSGVQATNCRVFGTSTSCKYETQSILNTNSMYRFFALVNNELAELSLRYPNNICDGEPVSVQIAPWYYKSSSLPSVLLNGVSSFFEYGYNYFYPLSNEYINSTKWSCIWPLSPGSPLTSNNNECISKQGNKQFNIMKQIAPYENSDGVSSFEYEISVICKELSYIILRPNCSDSLQNGIETDVDCGGNNKCIRCELGKKCFSNTDCASSLCTNNMCTDDYTLYIIIACCILLVLIIVIPVILTIVYVNRMKHIRRVRLRSVRKPSTITNNIPNPEIHIPKELYSIDIPDTI